MTQITVRTAVSRLRLDDDAVLRYIDGNAARALNCVGAQARTIARRQIRKQTQAVLKGKRKPEKGKPARWRRRGQHSLKDGIFYGYDPSTRELFVGPVLTSNKRQEGQTVPQWLENNGFSFMKPTQDIVDQKNIVMDCVAKF